ncbi:hypothetical protein [Clostridioides sp. ES-S-0010-02]|uniref:hypothetical protein n=1 Tax=Clostridioides sp. ES-S-0010-02 TaxID=2770776 RepID=UPI001D12BB50|nr:hypothetical protein JJC01_03885 [Clostridioides sp. ES-S-0010-02]
MTLDILPDRIKNYRDFLEGHISIDSFAIVPRRSNDRFVSQNGFFMLQGAKGISLDEEASEFLVKIELNDNIAEECRLFLLKFRCEEKV